MGGGKGGGEKGGGGDREGGRVEGEGGKTRGRAGWGGTELGLGRRAWIGLAGRAGGVERNGKAGWKREGRKGHGCARSGGTFESRPGMGGWASHWVLGGGRWWDELPSSAPLPPHPPLRLSLLSNFTQLSLLPLPPHHPTPPHPLPHPSPCLSPPFPQPTFCTLFLPSLFLSRRG